MGHTDGLRALGLAGVNGDDAAPDGFGHVRAGVDGHHDDGCHPDAAHSLEGHRAVGEVGQAVEDEHRL